MFVELASLFYCSLLEAGGLTKQSILEAFVYDNNYGRFFTDVNLEVFELFIDSVHFNLWV